MKRFFTLLLMAVLAFFVLRATVVTFDFSTAEGITAMGYAVPEPSAGTNLVQDGPVTVGGVTLSAVDGATPTRIWNSQGSYTLRIYVDGAITFSVAQGSITGVTINAANTANFDLIADVGDYSTAGDVGTWTGSAAAVSFTHVGSKNAQVATVVVTTSDEGPGDDPGDDPVDPNMTKLDSLVNLTALDDGTEFQFTTDVYVNYQWNDHLWVMQLDQEGYAYAALIYGDVDNQYPLGGVIPAGWTGIKNTYKGQVEIQNPAHFKNAKNILDEDYYSPIDCTGYLSTIANPAEGWENYKVYFEGVRLSDIDEHHTFTISCNEVDEDGMTYQASMTGYNKFGIDYPEVDPSEVYSIEGMVIIYNDIMELYPISIKGDQGTRLWKVLYEGEDGQHYKLNDTLYVAAASNAVDGKLVYVTDNVTEIYYDTYADWGYAEWMAWYPDWIALDCGDNEALFGDLVEMKVLAPGTVKGLLADCLTNPRLLLNSAPAQLAEADYPMLTAYDYNLSEDYLGALGNEMGRVEGYFFVKDGVPCLCSEQDTVVVKLCFDYAPELEAIMADKEGCQFGLLSIFKLTEPWDEKLPAKAPRSISATADDYFSNYTIYPLEVLSVASADEVMAGKLVNSVKYISPTGVVSEEPHEGVNIVVITWNDGSTTTFKRLAK